jgi:hypothetical protein
MNRYYCIHRHSSSSRPRAISLRFSSDQSTLHSERRFSLSLLPSPLLLLLVSEGEKLAIQSLFFPFLGRGQSGLKSQLTLVFFTDVRVFTSHTKSTCDPSKKRTKDGPRSSKRLPSFSMVMELGVGVERGQYDPGLIPLTF